MGVVLAVPFMMMGSANALSIMPASLTGLANGLGLVTLLGLVYWIWRVSVK